MTRNEFKLELLLLGYSLIADQSLGDIYIYSDKTIFVPEVLTTNTDMMCVRTMEMLATSGMGTYQIIIDTLINWLDKK